MSFWDIVWFIFISYVFIAYLMLPWAIIGDLFRDQDVNGFVKAVWLSALIVFPFMTALVYVIARGKRMTARAMERASKQRQQQDDYISSVAATSPSGAASPTEQIAQARALYDAGTIAQSEYEALKTKALV